MQRARIPAGEIAYLDRGAGTPVFLIHGFPLDHTMWDLQIDALAKNARVIAPDLRGFGESPLGDVDLQRGISMEQYADDLVALLEAIGITEPIVLIGLSMGGYIAWQFVRKHPQRVRALVQLDTRALADNDEGRAGRLKMAENVAEWGAGRIAEMMGPRLFSPRVFEKKSEIVAALRRVVERTSPAAIAAAQRGMAARPDVTGLLKTIKVPTLIVVGDQDVISPPSEMEAIARAIPNAEFAVIPDSGHMTTMENPEAVNAALHGFIAGLENG
jgi:pimeloyl-ACP methyl ester carboxylesterase